MLSNHDADKTGTSMLSVHYTMENKKWVFKWQTFGFAAYDRVA